MRGSYLANVVGHPDRVYGSSTYDSIGALYGLGFVQDRNATRDLGLGRSRKWRWSDTSGTSPAAVSVPLQSTAKTVV